MLFTYLQAIKALATVLRVQDPGVWSDSSTTHLYNAILSFTISTKPKVQLKRLCNLLIYFLIENMQKKKEVILKSEYSTFIEAHLTC